MSTHGHRQTASVSQNHKAQLANAYNELGKELASQKIRAFAGLIRSPTGAYGKVRMGTHRLTSTRVAIKQIPKAMSASLTREIHHHRQLHHPHVTQMYEVIATESHIWIVTELCSGGELFDYLAEKGRLSEDEARIIFGQLCLAVAYLHHKGIVHRDLKLENVLLDERCRVKLGDFGFTREYEKGVYMETFCGTTGYAAPEVLQGRRYLGPEVDIWSVGVILYCLLTGTLPFDDDDEAVMKEKVIKGKFEDPEWLSRDARDLLRDILQTDPSKRLTIPQILASRWFTSRTAAASMAPDDDGPASPSPARTVFPLIMKSTAKETRTQDTEQVVSSATSATSEMTFLSASSELLPFAPTTPDDNASDPFQDSSKSVLVQIHSNPSQSTITRGGQGSKDTKMRQPETVIEEERSKDGVEEMMPSINPSNPTRIPPHPTRTPARTKRRSVSSTLSDGNGSPSRDKPLAPLPPQDFAFLLSTPAPIIFSTPAERELLNTLSVMGFDTAQIVHSVISDACDSAGALWWMLMRKHEKRIVGEVRSASPDHGIEQIGESSGSKRRKEKESERPSGSRKRNKHGIAVQTDEPSPAPAPPEFALLPPTPTVASTTRPTTPPRAKSPFLSPSPTTNESSVRSNPSTPSGSYKGIECKDKDILKLKRDGKARSGSVSIMQRATTALEAAGLVRKKSAEVVKDQREGQREKEKSRENEKMQTGDDPRSSHGSGGSSKLTKSPPVRAKDAVTPSSSPSPDLPAIPGSPWVMAGGRMSPPSGYAPTPANSPGDTLTSLPNFTESGGRVIAPNRNRASLLSAFRLWFQEDKKGKRKETVQPLPQGSAHGLQYSRSMFAPPPSSASPSSKNTVKRRASGGGRGRRIKRHSASSRRSSSVNSRRSSGNSAQIFTIEQPHTLDQIPSVQSFGAETPNSERGDYSSRPSSVRSFILNGVPRHRKSPSTGSNGSAYYRTSSPLPKYNHRRAGSSSSTRVVRHIQSTPRSSRAAHHRSNSATSSVHSLASSRPTSFYEASEGEVTRTGSPFKGCPSRKSLDDSTPRRGAGTFIAQKRPTPFTSPHNSGALGRTSWKKSWGHEPPGWQSRSTHLPVEVLAISPAPDIRDVFSGGRQSLSMGDESDWVDEDEDVPEFAGGLGQMPGSATTSSSASSSHVAVDSPIPLVMSPPPRNHGGHTRATKGRASSGAGVVGRQRNGHSPAGRSSPAPGQGEIAYEAPEARGGRWQLPGPRGPAFKHAIQEEDEGEEE
ncbi:Pkinase-domain-containing protein [Lanmaoa asiatica]|nr:Pkinase-domain-containing protein [Lanmaoa asiatica]